MRDLIINGQIVLYGEVGDPWGWGDGFTPTDVMTALATLGEGPVTVRINSPGGIAMDGMAIYSLLKAHKGDITIAIDGVAASAASLIAMSGDKIEMRDGALMMIHDAATITFGNAEDHERSREFLDKISDNYAGVYAARAGVSREEAREIMKAETWLTADEAIEKGFADAKLVEPAAEAAMFDYRVYARAPKHLLKRVRTREQTASPQPKENKMSKTPAPAVVAPTPAPAPVAAVIPPVTPEPTPAPTPAPAPAPVVAAAPAPAPAPVAVVKPTDAILAACNAANLTLADSMAILQASDTLEVAQTAIIAKLAAGQAPANGPTPTAVVTADARDRFKQGVTRSLLYKVGLDGGEVNEFTGANLQTLARDYLKLIGATYAYGDPMQLAGAVLGMRGMSGGVFLSSGMHSTSDFVEILANVANKSMLKGYNEAEETFHLWTAKGVLVDFKPQKRVDLNLFPNLAEVPEGAEYQSGSIGNRGETIQLATYGKTFAITRQAIINDDLNAFSRIPNRMGRAAKRTIGNLVYAVLTGNPNMSDGTALFHADHNNLAGVAAAMTVASLDLARSNMARQKDPDSIAAGGLNIRPKFLIVPVTLGGLARTMMSAEKDPGASSPNAAKPNHIRGMATVIDDARLDTASVTAWYLAADPNMHDTVEVAYLNGNETPMIDQQDGWKVDGVEFKVRIDAGVKPLDFRALYKNAGA